MEWKLKSGEAVVDRYNSHLHQSAVPLLPEALARIESKGRNFLIEQADFGQPIGESICVATGPGDEIVFAKRPKRFGLTRFVKNRQAEPTSVVTLILKTADGQPGFILVTAFVGPLAEKEPWDSTIRNAEERQRSLVFWNSHALVWGGEETITGTETSRCPWEGV